ncbi:hypothetical protein [Microbulbifer taiwanensis]|uniref:hypothetical protein n=1 Tax=Microbulbifer taiwanensis TaxID=986746 RepID=UPI003612A46F
MAWQSAAIQFPPSAKALSDSVDSTLAQGRGEIDTALSRLGDVSPQFVKNPTAATAQGSAAAQNNLVALFGVDLRLLVVHPYQEGVGQGTGYSRHLSAPNAQLALAEKLGDAWDTHTPAGTLEAVAVLFAEQTLEAFAARLAAIGQAFPVPELRMAERRTDHLLRLEAEKSVLPGAPWAVTGGRGTCSSCCRRGRRRAVSGRRSPVPTAMKWKIPIHWRSCRTWRQRNRPTWMRCARRRRTWWRSSRPAGLPGACLPVAVPGKSPSRSRRPVPMAMTMCLPPRCCLSARRGLTALQEMFGL